MKIIWMKQRWQSQFPSRFMNINQIQINNEIHIFFTTISCIFKSFFLPLQRKNRRIMTFDKILDNNTLWAVRYDGALDNALEAHQSQTPSKWREEAEWRRDNWSWLQHSQKIAVKVLLKMKQDGLTQKALAERMNCTQQYVSKILKGTENMSLDTLTKLEDALNIRLILDERSVSYSDSEEATSINMVAEEELGEKYNSK